MASHFLHGCGVALVTPFYNNGNINFDHLKKVVDHVIEGGVDFIVALGTTGEATNLSLQECSKVLTSIHNFTAGRVPLVAGPFGGGGTIPVIKKIEYFNDILNLSGYKAIMASVPSYVKPSQEGIYQHFKVISEKSPLPVVVYNVPSRTGTHMKASTTLRLANDCSNIIAVKEASGDMVEGSLLHKQAPKNFTILSGDDLSALPLIATGAHGVISVVANAYPKLFSDMIKAAIANNFIAARKLHETLIELHPHLYVDGNPSGIKAVMDFMGLCERNVRLPLTEISRTTEEAIKAEMLKIQANTSPAIA